MTWYEVKDVEKQLLAAIEARICNKQTQHSHLNGIVTELLAAYPVITTWSAVLKPSAGKASYGSGNEPKTDLVLIVNGHKRRISVKAKRAAYNFSALLKELDGMIKAALSLAACDHEETLVILEILRPAREVIGRSVKIADYQDIETAIASWTKPAKIEALKGTIREDVQRLMPEAIAIIRADNSKYSDDYYRMLRQCESTVRNAFTTVFTQFPKFHRALYWESLTGAVKFGNRDAAADTLIYCEEAEIVDIADLHGNWFNGVIVPIRLQNVPRGHVNAFKGAVKHGAPMTAQTLADVLRAIDLTLKM